jgi:4-hydroxymandelate oxidase
MRLDLYMRDMLREFGLESAAGERGRAGWSYSELATALIERCVPAQEPVDLLVLAYSTPDINPGRNMAALLSGRCPGSPLAFGLADQGPAAPFTSLRLIREYARTAGLHRALLLVVEQAALPYHVGDSVALPAAHTGVALLLGHASDETESAPHARLGEIKIRLGAGESSIEQEIKALFSDYPKSTVILGSALADSAERAGVLAAGAGRVRVAQRGRPLTGLWWELADELETAERSGAAGSIVLCDYDSMQGCVCVAVLGADSGSGQSHVRGTTRKGSAPVSAIAAL